MADKRVLITDQVFGGTEIERSVLEPRGFEVVEAPAKDEETLSRLVAGVDGILVCYAQVTPAVLKAAGPSCKIVARFGIGYDNVAVQTATELGVVVTNVPDYCLDEVADHTIALLLAMARGVAFADREVRTGEWHLPDLEIHRIRGRRLALIGVGRIGRRVASRAQAFGLEVVAYDPFVQTWDMEGIARADTLEEALGEADFVSLHSPLTAENHHLIGERTIAMMHKAPVIVNTARGPLVDNDAVLAALDRGQLGGVALDVTEPEPLPADHPLRRHPRALVTPHMSFLSNEAQDELRQRAAEEVARVVAGEAPRNPVNPEVLKSAR